MEFSRLFLAIIFVLVVDLVQRLCRMETSATKIVAASAVHNSHSNVDICRAFAFGVMMGHCDFQAHTGILIFICF